MNAILEFIKAILIQISGIKGGNAIPTIDYLFRRPETALDLAGRIKIALIPVRNQEKGWRWLLGAIGKKDHKVHLLTVLPAAKVDLDLLARRHAAHRVPFQVEYPEGYALGTVERRASVDMLAEQFKDFRPALGPPGICVGDFSSVRYCEQIGQRILRHFFFTEVSIAVPGSISGLQSLHNRAWRHPAFGRFFPYGVH